MAVKKEAVETKTSIYSFAKAWGKSAAPAVFTGGAIALTIAPKRYLLPVIFQPVFHGAAFVNLTGYKHDYAGITAAWSGLYLVLAARRKTHPAWDLLKWQMWLRRALVPMCFMNVVGGGLVYLTEKRTVEKNELKETWEKLKSLVQ